jgi:hypothetical protein
MTEWGGNNLNKSNIMRIGIVGTLVLIILASGCISSPTTDTKTFSDGAMSFNYPSDFDNGTYSADDTDLSSPMKKISQLNKTVPNIHYIFVEKNISRISPIEARDGLISVVKNSSAYQLVSNTTETNQNGVVIEKTSYTTEYILGSKIRYNDLYFKINDNVYRITVYGSDIGTHAQSIESTTNIIFQSIK